MKSMNNSVQFELRQEGDSIYFRPDPEEEFIPARIVRLRPLGSELEQISIMHRTRKQELVYLPSVLDAPELARTVIMTELSRRYFIPEISRISKLVVRLGNYFLDVETSAGEKQIVMHNPAKNVLWLADNHCMLRDTRGNWFVIGNVDTLDKQSRDLVRQAF